MAFVKKSVAVLAISVLSSVYLITASANEPLKKFMGETAKVQNEVDQYIANLYNGIDFGKDEPLQYPAFEAAMKGYLNLKSAGKLNQRPLLTVADFTLSSNKDRLWTIDLDTKKVLFHSFVAHGQGSGDEFATTFSNKDNSHQSSIGFYVTGEIYNGEHGNSLRLYGMDNGYNNAAFDRGIVMHAAAYVSNDFICNNERLGRSWGCPAVNPKLAPAIINTIKEGTCLFIYYPQKSYLKTAYWLNRQVDFLQNSKNLQTILPLPAKQLAAGVISHDPLLTNVLLQENTRL